MGFIHDIRRLIEQMPARRQTLMFSATMPHEIRLLARTLLHDPIHVKVATESPAADTVRQSLYFVDPRSKAALLEHLLRDSQITRALVFTRTKHRADRVVRRLAHAAIAAEAIHSNKSQNARQRALANFTSGRTRVLVASDIAARGLDVDRISHVFNYDLPDVAETYVHRIGRTGRAGAGGQAISFCTEDQRDDLREIERLLGRHISVLRHSTKAPPPASPQARALDGSRPKEGATEKTPSAPAARTTAKPQRKKNESWRSRQRRSSQARGRSGSRSGPRGR